MSLDLPAKADLRKDETARLREPPDWRLSSWLLAAGIVAFAGFGALLAVWPRAAAGGWLAAFLLVGGVAIGAVFAQAIHAVTGGRWLAAFADVFQATAAATAILALSFIPVLVLLSSFYPWVESISPPPADVRSLYLNPPFFILRAIVALVFWSLAGTFLPRLGGGRKALAGAVALVFHVFIIGLIGVDWVLSLQPEFWSSAFGATLAFTQFAAALAWALMVAPGERDSVALGDLAGLLLAALLGLVYLNFIGYLVIWYGNLPDRVFWFTFRETWPWPLVGGLAFLFGALLPIVALLFERVRSSRRGLRFIGATALVGFAFYYAWLIAPPFGARALGAAILAAAGMLFLVGAFAFAPARTRRL